MNSIKIETTEKERFFVPRIVSTTAPEGQKIDLSFIQMIQRDRNAKEYIANVAYKNSLKAAQKRNRWNKLKVSVLNVLCGISFVAGGFVLILIGAIL